LNNIITTTAVVGRASGGKLSISIAGLEIIAK